MYGEVRLRIVFAVSGPVQPDPLVVQVVFDSESPMLVQLFRGVRPAWPFVVQVGRNTITMITVGLGTPLILAVTIGNSQV